MRCRQILLLLLLTTPQVFAEEATNKHEESLPTVQVGKLGDLSTLEIQGIAHFTADDLHDALGCSLAVQAACRPTAPLLALVEQLEETLADGYAHSGCPGTMVRVSMAEDGLHLVAEVKEAPRYTAGEVRIEGVEGALAEAIRRRLTTATDDIRPRPGIYFYRNKEPLGHQKIEGRKGQDNAYAEPLWVTGEPARGSQQRLNDIRQAVADELSLAGHPLAGIGVSVEPTDDGIAVLAVDIANLGPTATLKRIEFNGLQRHSREELLALLGIRESEDYDLAKLIEAHDRLRDSCRFWKHDLVIELPVASPESRYATQDAPIEVLVVLTEYVHVAKLGEPLSAEDEALRRTGLWVNRCLEQRDWDLRISCRVDASEEFTSEGKLTAILSPQEGVFVSGSGFHRKNDNKTPWKFSLISTSTELGVTDAEQKRRWSLPNPSPPKVNFCLMPGVIEDGLYKCYFRFNLGFRSNKNLANGFQIHTCPVVWVNEAHRDEVRCQIDDGVLVVKQPYGTIRVDASSGRLLELAFWGDEPGYCSIKPIEHSEGYLEENLAALDQLPNEYDPERPLASWCTWGLAVVEQLSHQEPIVPEATRKLLKKFADSEMLKSLSAKRETESEFSKAWEYQTAEGVPGTDFSFEGNVPWGAVAADRLFVRETWPWTLFREVAFIKAEVDPKLQGLSGEFQRVVSRNDTGPLAHWTIFKLGYGGQRCIDVGLQAFEDASFDREVAMLTTPDTGMMKVLKHAVPLVQSLPEEDTAWLCDLAGEGLSPSLQQTCELLRKLDATSDETLQSSLAELLRGEVRTMVEADLRTAAMTSVAAEPDEAQRR